MCDVKTGSLVNDLQDIRNLTIGVIFRQLKEFKREELLSAVNYYLTGSYAAYTDSDLQIIVDSTLHMCTNNNWLMMEHGLYSPKEIIT